MPDPTTIPVTPPVGTSPSPLSPAQKSDWNSYVAQVNSLPGGDINNQAYLAGYKKDNPDSTLTPDHIAQAQDEVQKLKNGIPVGKMTPEQAKIIQGGMSYNYKNGTNPNYPVSPTHAHDLEAHAEANKGGDKIPTPNYQDPQSRLNYAAQFTKKYGPLMQGRGDTPLRINEVPFGGKTTAREMSAKAAAKFGLDPALLYSSAMEEGMSGIFPDKNGEADDSGDKDYPTQGSASFGMDHFASDFPDLVKKGYLPASFQSRFKVAPSPDKTETQDSANYKSPEDAILAKAALVKSYQDQTEQFAKKNNIALTPRSKEFFALAAYNGGAGNMQKMMKEYSEKGALKDDNFINNPNTGSYKTIHTNISRRILMRDSLRKEGLF